MLLQTNLWYVPPSCQTDDKKEAAREVWDVLNNHHTFGYADTDVEPAQVVVYGFACGPNPKLIAHTLLHELGHIIAPKGAAHGDAWVEKCTALGIAEGAYEGQGRSMRDQASRKSGFYQFSDKALELWIEDLPRVQFGYWER